MMPRCLFVTGKLAAQSLKNTLDRQLPDFEYEVAVLPISVAALMDTRFVAKHLTDANGCDKVMIPGLCKGDIALIAEKVGVEVIRGPSSLKTLPEYFGKTANLQGFGAYKTKIIAEIVDAHQYNLDAILEKAAYFRACGADIIDLGCPLAGGFSDIGSVIKALKAKDYVVSVDSFNEEDILRADQAGADYVLSVNSQNIEIARRLRSRVVVIPDFEQGIGSLERSMSRLEAWHVPYIVDPVLRPIGLGFAESIGNYIEMRRKYPGTEMLIGAGNLTELTDADTTGITAVLAGIIAELKIEYVLTTEVISWARGAVRELDIARRIMHYACENKMLPKHLNNDLITVKDPPFESFGEAELRAMKEKVHDRNFRVFADRSSIYVFNNHRFVKGTDTQAIFDQLDINDAGEAFYLGRELERAHLAMRLGKKYVQEEELRWGYLNGFSFPVSRSPVKKRKCHR